MYYPIIDKLKEIMADITSVKEKDPLIIEGTITSASSGIWTGNWDDIVSAFNSNKPVYFKITVGDTTFLIPVIALHPSVAESGIIYFNQMTAYGEIQSDNDFYLVPIQ